MHMNLVLRRGAVLLAASTLLVACGTDSDTDSATTPETTEETSTAMDEKEQGPAGGGQ